eukprot:TRINITY_DN4760_c0_g1_i4.p1 TRINITY_DN4760_c0_g1~~TRINITY_DN4760_c0_g1_i4.p1  ORF type:complete len:143 (-),score=19.12 TRINITY_DN4760_c0_g1_i4:190-618(-)
MIDSGPFSTLPSDLVEKLLTEYDFSLSDVLSWHFACPRLFTRSMLHSASLKYYTRLLFLNQDILLEKYSPEADRDGVFVRHLAASEEAQAKREGVIALTPFRTLAVRINGEVVMCGEHLLVDGYTPRVRQHLFSPTVMLEGF